ncbi:Ig-like domain-containing protein [Noviherbaspirillum pedocola]|uniref:Uncharacterized protein n=1 Tax=Noviherbaspirillum pedocola TaxID=2801341 RepID=A0A934SUM3_9BURK|nr:Ig-like domain-containing protein [Noviherbaspirillum pedocola]MBK4735874.1 hypothetical protein [Noviherbaspirillum pedocola]
MKTKLIATAALIAAVLAGCGGGGGSSTPTTAVKAPAVLVGTVATGAALAGAIVTITDHNGASACVETNITSAADGSFSCTLKEGEQAPFYVIATDPTGKNSPMTSVVIKTPESGLTGTVNVTPLTTAIVLSVTGDGSPQDFVSKGTIDPTALASMTDKVVAQLGPMLSTLQMPTGYNPFTSQIMPSMNGVAGNGADTILDLLRITHDAQGQIAIGSVGTTSTVPLGSTSIVSQSIADSFSVMVDLSKALPIEGQLMNACFTLPVSSRVLGTDTSVPASSGGPTITGMAAACQNLFSNGSNANGAPAFRDNGYSAGQFFYAVGTSNDLTGVQIAMPQILSFIPAAKSLSGKDEAILDFNYVDKQGNMGDIVTTARYVPNSATPDHPVNWWLVGNQGSVDITVHDLVRQFVQTNPNNTDNFSSFQSGVQFAINAGGPGSVNANGDMLNMARVKGPGLPAAGIVLSRNVYGPGNMDLFNITGSTTSGAACGGYATNCSEMWLARTMGLTGAAATTAATTSPGAFGWIPQGSGFDVSQFTDGQHYQVELFYGSNTGAADATVSVLMIEGVPAATDAADLGWVDMGSNTSAALTTGGEYSGSPSSIPVDWNYGMSADIVTGAAVSLDIYGSLAGGVAVPLGAQSVTVPTPDLPALSDSNTRAIRLDYRTPSTLRKSSVFSYN